MAGTMDSGTVAARVRRNNPNVRNQRRDNKKPRKAPPTAQQPQQANIADPVTSDIQPTRDAALDAQVDRMRQPSAPPIPAGLMAPAVDEAGIQMPNILDFDPKTRAMIMGSILKELLHHPELLDGM